jgi:hypothetical protein
MEAMGLRLAPGSLLTLGFDVLSVKEALSTSFEECMQNSKTSHILIW